MEHGFRDGTKIFTKNNDAIVNYPAQQMEHGIAKNKRTNYAYKKGVRLLKRVENIMVEDGVFRELPSFFIECLVYNCPDIVFKNVAWIECLRAMLLHIWNGLQGDEPDTNRWVEVNECFFLFHSNQKWTREDGREFSKAAWNYFGFK